MIIRVLDRNYFVQQTISSDNGLVQYVCTNVAEDDGRFCRIVRIPLPEVDTGLIRYLSDIYKAGSFRELVQYANEGGYMQVVLDCGAQKARTLKEILEEGGLTLKARLNMGEKLLERLILSDVPDFFALGAMDTDHVCFTEVNDCSFVFELANLKNFEKADTAKVHRKLRFVLDELFAKELKDERVPELRPFLDRISQLEFPTNMALYQAYEPLAAELALRDEDSMEGMSLPYRIWEKIKAAVRFLHSMFFVVVILIAIAYLVLSIRNFVAPPAHKDVYKSVGDLQIVSETDGAENGSGAAKGTDEAGKAGDDGKTGSGVAK